MGKETIVVERVGPFGVLVNGDWMGVNDELKPPADHFENGGAYSVLTSKTAKGKTYINRILEQEQGSSEPARKQAERNVGMSTNHAPQPELDKNERIIRQGVYQAVSQSPAIVPFILKKEDFVAIVAELSEEIINKIKGA